MFSRLTDQLHQKKEDYTSRTTECFYAYITDQLDKNNARGKLKKKKVLSYLGGKSMENKKDDI